MRVGAIPQRDLLDPIARILATEEPRDRVVIIGSLFKRFQGVGLSGLLGNLALGYFIEKIGVPVRGKQKLRLIVEPTH